MRDIITDMFYDGYGRLTKTSVPYRVGNGSGGYYPPLSQTGVITSYDILSRPLTVTATDGSTVVTQNNYLGFDRQVVDARGNTTTYTSDAWGRLVTLSPAINPGVTYTYDAMGRMLTASRGGSVTTYTYDKGGRVTQIDDPDLGTITYSSYDAFGNLLSQTDPRGCTTTMAYDILSRIKTKSYSGCASTPGVTYTYDSTADGNFGIGFMTGMQDSAGRWSYAWKYSGRREKTEERFSIDGYTFQTGWSYDPASRVATMTYPGDAGGGAGETVNYSYLPQGPLDRVYGTNTYVNNSYVDQAGRLYYRSLNNASDVVATTYTFFDWSDTNGWGRLQSYSDNMSFQNLAYTYDANSNVKTISDAVAGSPQVQTYTYDNLDRIYSSIITGGTYGDEIYRNYFYETTTGNMNQNGFLIMEYDGVHPHAFTRGHSSGTTTDKNVTVRARATSSTLAWPSMKLYVNGVEMKTWTVNSTAYANYTTTVPLTGKDYIDVVYTNDTSTQNLYVDYVTVDTKTVQAEGGAAIVDSGTGPGAFDGLGVTPGQELLSSNASLRFVTGTNTFSGGYDAGGNLAHRVILDKAFFLTYDAENRLVGVSEGTTASYLYNGLDQLIYSEDEAGTTYYVGEYFEMYVPAAGGQALIGGEASGGEGENGEVEAVESSSPTGTVSPGPAATSTFDGTTQPSTTPTQQETLEPTATAQTQEPSPTPTTEGTPQPSPTQTSETTPEPSATATLEGTPEPAPTQTEVATLEPSATTTVEATPIPSPIPGNEVLFADDFERPDGDLIGNDWVETEIEGAAAGIQTGRMCFLDTSDWVNRPMVSRSFSAVPGGQLTWELDFARQPLTGEESYALFMQLGEGKLMDADSPQAGVGVDLVWTKLDGTDQTLAYLNGEKLEGLRTLSGPATLTIQADLDTHTYSVSIDGVLIQSGLPFDNKVSLDTVRFIANELDEATTGIPCFDNLEFSVPSTTETRGSSGFVTAALAGLRSTFIQVWQWLGGQLVTVRQAFAPSIVHAALPAGTAFRSYYFTGKTRVAMRVESDADPDHDELYFILHDHPSLRSGQVLAAPR